MEKTFTLTSKRTGNNQDIYFMVDGECVAYIREVTGGSYATDVKDEKFGGRQSFEYITKAKPGYDLNEMISRIEDKLAGIIGTCKTSSRAILTIGEQGYIFQTLWIAAGNYGAGFGNYTKSQNAKNAKIIANAQF